MVRALPHKRFGTISKINYGVSLGSYCGKVSYWRIPAYPVAAVSSMNSMHVHTVHKIHNNNNAQQAHMILYPVPLLRSMDLISADLRRDGDKLFFLFCDKLGTVLA